jgi:2-hydroxychromene-2-carboxylate isomerase
VGWTGLDLQAHQTDPQIAAALTEARAKINSDGIFGVPFLIDGHEKYWGQDRFDLWLETL